MKLILNNFIIIIQQNNYTIYIILFNIIKYLFKIYQYIINNKILMYLLILYK